MSGVPPEEDAASRFASDARAAGLKLPSSGRLDPRLAGALVAVLVAASLSVGYATNWMALSRPAADPLADLPGCSGGGVTLNVATEANSTASLAGVWPALASAFSAATGRCLAVTTVPLTAGLTALSARSTDALIGPQVPDASTPGGLVTETYDVPLLVSPVVVLVNSQGLPAELNLSVAALAGAYLGTVHTWSDPELTSSNPALRSSLAVSVVHLDGPSEADAVFSAYLAAGNASFRTAVGSGPNVSWPVGLDAASPSNVTSIVASTPGAIGFEPTDVCPSAPSAVVCAAVEAGGGTYVDPTPPEVAAAAKVEANSSAAIADAWDNVTGVAPATAAVYPMIETTYAVVYRDLGTAYGSLLSLNESKWLVALLFWIASGPAGAADAVEGPAGYDPLPGGLAFAAEEITLNVTYLGNWILLPASALQEGPAEGGNETGEF